MAGGGGEDSIAESPESRIAPPFAGDPADASEPADAQERHDADAGDVADGSDAGSAAVSVISGDAGHAAHPNADGRRGGLRAQ